VAADEDRVAVSRPRQVEKPAEAADSAVRPVGALARDERLDSIARIAGVDVERPASENRRAGLVGPRNGLSSNIPHQEPNREAGRLAIRLCRAVRPLAIGPAMPFLALHGRRAGGKVLRTRTIPN